MEQPASPSRHVAWKPSDGPNGSVPGPTPGLSSPNSKAASPMSSPRGSGVNLAAETAERPPNRRTRSKFGRPRYFRSKTSSNSQGPETSNEVPASSIAQFAQRTQNNLRMWYLSHNDRGSSRRRSEMDRLREIKKSQMLFAQIFAVTPMVLVSASSLQAEDAVKKVPVVLQQLTIRVFEEEAKHYRNMLRIQLEYGSGFGVIKWEIVRGYRDLVYLRAKLRARTKHNLRSKKVKLPKLPRPKLHGEKDLKHQHSNSETFDEAAFTDDEEIIDPSSSEEEEEDGAQFTSYEQGQDGAINAEAAPAANHGHASGAASVAATGISSRRESVVSAGRDGYVDSTSALNHIGSPVRQRSHARRAHEQSWAREVEDWLNKIKYIYTFRSDSNDLMQFLELSHLSLKLSSEYNFHGKEGTLIVRSRASEMGWRVNHWHPRDFQDMVERHTKKWVLIRDSYLVIVDNIYSTRIREVFFMDSHFKVKHITEEQEATQEEATHSYGGTGDVIEAVPDAQDVHKRNRARTVFLHLVNNERVLKLAATSERDLRRWQGSILQMKSRSPWSKKNRFDSFAPVRKNVFGQWFVDGRDYMWVLSEALENARDTIFILDWWLSPELYLRRPPEGNQKWRLDRVLKRKAEEGVKIFVIVYRNVGPTIPIDSMWTKHSLLDLHPNIHVMRSPNQLSNKSSLFWAHHEKLCVIDSTIAFNGGIDLCFGRWDTWQHTLIDDASKTFLSEHPTPEEWKETTQLFPGKDYSNARVKDFYELNRPFDDMYDRAYVPRMPWHDIHQMVVGQPARDLARHFVQRWNYVLRQKIPSRPTPLLLPPADFTQEDLERLQLTGTCEYQVLRSSGEWSLGLQHHEQSIQNAYLKLIEESEHLVYIENQFFITSTEVDGVLIENQIGNALVQRIVRAHENGEDWKAFILIPLMPGFEAEVDSDKASSVRVICQCQFNSISRGPHSIFYRLERLGIRPDQYINFFSLRKWGKFSDTPDAPNGGRLVTELLYIHAKCMVVDDRVAIIGSANINERSMRGLRDSEVAVCVRDTKVVESKMAGKPWKASKFAHTLRKRLMREHLGVDLDKLEIVERFMDSLDASVKKAKKQGLHSRHREQHLQAPGPDSQPPPSPAATSGPSVADADQFPEWLYPELHSFNWYAGTSVNRGVRDYKKFSHDSRVQKNAEHHADVNGEGFDHWKERENQSEGVKTREYKAAEPDLEMEKEAKAIMDALLKDRSIKSREQFKRVFYSKFTKQDILRPVKRAGELPLPHTDEDGLRAVNNENIPIDPWMFDDPLSEQFVNDKWNAVAERNTLIFRLVFRCQPDDEVETWKDYKTYVGHLERFYEKQREEGGPSALRESGHHEPERVDRYVLDGSIKRPNGDPRLNQGPNRKPIAEATALPRQNTLLPHNPIHIPGQEPVHSAPPRRAPAHATTGTGTGTAAGPTPGHTPGHAPMHSAIHKPAHEHTQEHAYSSMFPHQEYKHHLSQAAQLDERREHMEETKAAEMNGTVPAPNGEAQDHHHHHGHHRHRLSGSDHSLAEIEQELDRMNLNNSPEAARLRELYLEKVGTGFPNEGVEFTPPPADGEGERSTVEFPGLDGNRQNLKPSVSTNSARRRAMTGTNAPPSSKPARRWGHFEHVLDAQVAEDMLQGITGHLVVFPTEWLNRELDSGNWNFQLDRIAPLEIYD